MIRLLLIKLMLWAARKLAKRTDTLLDDEAIDAIEMLARTEPNDPETETGVR